MGKVHLAGAVAGGLAGGLALTGLLIAMERISGKPSELIGIERSAAARLGIDTLTASELPGTSEQLAAQAGHLALSALAGAAYAALADEGAGVVTSGLAFGLGFYVAAHVVTGPLLGVSPPEWRKDPRSIAMHVVNHAAFGLVIAWSTRAADRR